MRQVTKEDVMEKVWTACRFVFDVLQAVTRTSITVPRNNREMCLDYLKSEEGCSLFCVFVEHIERDHALEVMNLYKQADYRDEPLVI